MKIEPISEFRGFKLDPFQIKAIEEIEKGHSLVLSAPTGSGKTLVAEYLIEKVLKTDQRIIYTSPIKALSNQKFRDFSRAYGDKIGILTGDVVINREAQALIMTTEVYRNMAVEDPDAIGDVAYVVFDEIHYLGDIERGTVWEESIIFSRKDVRFLALSATIPNAEEFARWIESNLDHRVSVITHDKRSVPLVFSFYFKNRLYNYRDLIKSLGKGFKSDEVFPREKKSEDGKRHLDIVRQMKQYDRLPLLYFAFSRALVDSMAEQASRVFDFTTPSEKKYIDEICESYIAKYDLQNLESAVQLRNQLLHGVGRHHAGLLPQLKELVEILFGEKLLKVLFVTETFALGVNMPARTVAFDTLKKFDGRSFRIMKSLEFRQISGRAGRRGIDEKGWVVVPFLPREFSLEELESVVYGDVEPLLSQFDLSFNSVLNLYAGRKEDEIKTILKKNFAQFQANKELPRLAEKISFYRSQIENLFPKCIEQENDLENFAAFFKRKQETINSLVKQLGNTERGLRGRKNRWVRERLRQEYHETLQKLSDEEAGFICGKCKSKGRCTGKLFQIAKVQKKLAYWKDLYEKQEHLHLPVYERKIAILKHLGYIDEKGFLARGEFASKIHIEEITVTELYFRGVFHEWEHHEINALAVSLVYEFRRRGGELPRPPRVPGLERIRQAKSFVSGLSKQYDFVKPLDITLAYGMAEWSKGADFEDVVRLTPIPEGDLIRYFRQAIDLLRQIREATSDMSLREKLSNCIGMINRDIILATELRD